MKIKKFTDVCMTGGMHGESHMKQTGMLVVSLRGVNFGILVSLRVFRAKPQYFMCACIGYDDHFFISLKPAHCMSYLCVFKRSPLGAKICLNTERSYITRLRCSACQSEIPTDDQCSNLIGLFTQV